MVKKIKKLTSLCTRPAVDYLRQLNKIESSPNECKVFFAQVYFYPLLCTVLQNDIVAQYRGKVYEANESCSAGRGKGCCNSCMGGL